MHFGIAHVAVTLDQSEDRLRLRQIGQFEADARPHAGEVEESIARDVYERPDVRHLRKNVEHLRHVDDRGLE
jgi:hypothetical protein